MQTTVYDLNSDALKTSWNELAAKLEKLYNGRFISMVDSVLRRENPDSRGFTLDGGGYYRDVFFNRKDPMVCILYVGRTPKPLDKLNAKEILASVPFSRVQDPKTSNVLILPMGLQKWPLALGFSPLGRREIEPTPRVTTKLFEEIRKQFPKSVILTRFAGNHTEPTGAVKLWSRMFPQRFCVGWASYDNIRDETVYPEQIQLEQDLKEAQDAYFAAQKIFEELKLEYKRIKHTDKPDLDKQHIQEQKNAAKQRMKDLKKIYEDLDELDEDFDVSAAVKRIDKVHDVAGPIEHNPVQEDLRAPIGSGVSYENDTLTIRAGMTPVIRIEHASKIPPVKMLLNPYHYDLTGTIFVAWNVDATPEAQAAFVDACML